MTLTLVSNGNTIFATDINQIINVLQQPSGGQEKGKYSLNGWGNAASDNMGNYMPSLSRNATPVSVTIDEADISHTGNNANPAATTALTANGFLVYSSSSAATLSWKVGGNWTIQY